MTKLLIKLTIKLLTWLKKDKKCKFDFNSNDRNDLDEWIDFLKSKL